MSGLRAIVIGASIGGLLAARALADFFDRVTLIERDTFPPVGEPRKGVPQGRHTHVLLSRGRDILEGLFPGLTVDLIEQGAPLLNRPDKELIWFDSDGYHCRFTSDRTGALLVSRLLLEGYVRQRVMALPDVTAIEQCNVLGLVSSEDHARVQGVQISARSKASTGEVLEADLVIDASGQRSKAPKWLQDLGYVPPEEEQVTVNFAYTTRLYRRRSEDLAGAKAVIITLSPSLKRGGIMIAQENDRWTLSLSGFKSDSPPTDEAGFLAYARTLGAPDIYNVIKDAEPLSDFIRYRYKASRRRCYEKLHRFPEGFLVFGDAICSFNPVYGQGMSVACMEALDLQGALRQGTENLWRRFFARAKKSIDSPWQIVVGGDLRFPEAEGKRTPAIRLINAYLNWLHIAAHHDPVVARSFNEVASLLAPPASLMRFKTVRRVLWGNMRWRAMRSRSAAGR